jgi:hypothetical protein
VNLTFRLHQNSPCIIVHEPCEFHSDFNPL